MRHANIFLLLILFFLVDSCDRASAQNFEDLLGDPAFATQETEPSLVLNGVVTQRKKYSVMVRSGDQAYEIKLPTTVPISRELIRPKFDLENSSVEITLPCTGLGGDQTKNAVVSLELPQPCFLVATFSTSENLEAFRSGRVNTIGHFAISKKPQNVESDRKLAGVLTGSPQGYSFATDEKNYPVELGTKVNLLSGFSILDLDEGSEVTLKADRVDDQWVAQRIQFQKVPTADVGSIDLPRLLSLGDMVSFSYQRALHEQLAGQYQVSHPPANCGGSSNWKLVNRWLGDCSEKKWDVILFNAGMLDSKTSKSDYQTNLREWLRAIEPAGKQVVWLTTTPIQEGVEEPKNDELLGKVPGRMKLQNEWAEEVLAEYPNVKTCDLWQVVVEGREAEFKDWWSKTRPQFNFRQSKKLAAAIAETLANE